MKGKGGRRKDEISEAEANYFRLTFIHIAATIVFMAVLIIVACHDIFLMGSKPPEWR